MVRKEEEKCICNFKIYINSCETGELAIEDISNDACNSQTSGTMHSVQSVSNPDRILEENENEEVLVNDKFKTPLQVNK